MKLLLIVPSAVVARIAGMGATGRHRADKDVSFWWPELGMDQLQGRHVDRVVVSPNVRLSRVTRQGVEAMTRALVIDL